MQVGGTGKRPQIGTVETCCNGKRGRWDPCNHFPMNIFPRKICQSIIYWREELTANRMNTYMEMENSLARSPHTV